MDETLTPGFYQAKIEEYRKNKEDALERLTGLQNQANQIVIDVHQLDGAIGALTGLMQPPEDSTGA